MKPLGGLALFTVKAIAIVALLAVTVVTTVPFLAQARSGPRPGQQRAMTTIVHLKQAALATLIYASENGDVIPYALDIGSVRRVLLPHAKSQDVFFAATPERRFFAPSPQPEPFQFNFALAGVRHGDVPHPDQTVLWYLDRVDPDGLRTVAFADGHCRRLGPDEWREAEPSLRARYPRQGRPLPKDWMPNPVR